MIAILDKRGVTLPASGDDWIIAPSGNTLLGAVVVAPRHSSAVPSNPAA